jgi:hypothetical protein
LTDCLADWESYAGHADRLAAHLGDGHALGDIEFDAVADVDLFVAGPQVEDDIGPAIVTFNEPEVALRIVEGHRTGPAFHRFPLKPTERVAVFVNAVASIPDGGGIRDSGRVVW